jgi:hypothetical protein
VLGFVLGGVARFPRFALLRALVGAACGFITNNPDYELWLRMAIVGVIVGVASWDTFAPATIRSPATVLNPVLVSLSGSLGASVGEFSSYVIGYSGARVATKRTFAGLSPCTGLDQKYVFWAIAFLFSRYRSPK